MAHALNNATGNVYAALDSLERLPDSAPLARAKRALESASTALQALSAANHVMSKAAEPLAPGSFEGWPVAQCLQPGLWDSLHELGSWQIAPPESAPREWALGLDPHSVRALVLCLAYALRKAIGAQATLSGQARLQLQARAASLDWFMQVSGQQLSQQTLEKAHHPCVLALQTAGSAPWATEFELIADNGALCLRLPLHRLQA